MYYHINVIPIYLPPLRERREDVVVTLKNVLRSVEAEYINQVLNECNGKIGEAARLFGIHRTMLYRKLNNKKSED